VKLLFLSSFAHLALDPASDRVSGGAELQVALLARELAGRGYPVVLAGGDIGQPDGTILQGVKTRVAGKFHTGSAADTLQALPHVLRVLRQERPTHVLVLGWTAWLFVLHLLKPFFGYKLVFICGLDTEVDGGFRRENPVRGALFEHGMRRCDIRFAMTRLQESLFQKNGMTCALYRNLILPRTAPRTAPKTVDFLWVSRCQPIKQPHLFLDLVEQIPEARCEMICPREDAGLWESVHARAAKLPNLTFHERIPYHQIQGHYDAARIFVNTSRAEGWPNSFIQSGLGETAILSLSVKPDDLFERFQLGALAGGDFAQFAAQARRMHRDRALTDRMGAEAARFVRELHDNAAETDAFLSGIGRPAAREAEGNPREQ